MLRRFAPRNDDGATRGHLLAAQMPEFCHVVAPQFRGRRECRGRAAPAVSYANGEGARMSIQAQRRHPDIPCVMALRLMPRSPRRRIRLVTVIGGFLRHSTRSGQTCHRRLGTSNGCQDHTVLPYAQTSFVVAHLLESLTRFTRPAIPWRADALASTTSHPAFVTTRDRPSCRNGTNDLKPLIWGLCEAQSCPSCHCAATRRALPFLRHSGMVR